MENGIGEMRSMDMMHLTCLRCGKPAVSIPFHCEELGIKVSYTHYSYCEECLREGLKMLKEKDLEENKKRYAFKQATMKLKDILPLIRSSGYDNRDEGGTDIIICPECEEWTHVKFNLNSGLLELLGELTVENIDAKDDNIVLWIKTDDFNYIDGSIMYMEHYKRGREDEAGLRDGTIMQTCSLD